MHMYVCAQVFVDGIEGGMWKHDPYNREVVGKVEFCSHPPDTAHVMVIFISRRCTGPRVGWAGKTFKGEVRLPG